MKRKNIIIIIISIILILTIAGGSLAYLYMTTDFMKDNKVLFAKYINQDIEIFENITQSSVPSAYREFYKTNNYESETNIKVGYSEGGEVSNPFNNLSMKINSQRDNDNNYFYCDAQLLYANEEYFEIEAIKDQKTYGIRFSDVLRQFFSVTDDDAINAVSADLGIDKSSIYSFFDIIDGKEPTGDKEISETKINTLKDKYSKLIVQNISDVGKYSKLKNSIITINNTSTKTNAYTLSLTGEQVKQVAVKILTEVRNDGIIDEIMDNKIIDNMEGKINNNNSNSGTTDVETSDSQNVENANSETSEVIATETKTFKEKIDELIEKIQENENIGELKITVYEKSGTTVRTSIENGTNRIIIDNVITNDEIRVNFQRTKLNTEQASQQAVIISKKQTNDGETFNIEAELKDGESSENIKLENEMKKDGNGINNNMKITYSKNITEIMVGLENKTSVVTQPIEKKEIGEQENIVLNKLNDEARKKIIEILKEKVNAKIDERTIALKTKLGLITEEPTEPEEPIDESQMTQVDINRFNSKFEFYTGDSLTSENVKALLKNVEANLKSIEFPLAQTSEGSNKQAQSIKLNIEKDTSNSELIKQVESRIEENRKYKVEIAYKTSNGMIDYIVITESR